MVSSFVLDNASQCLELMSSTSVVHAGLRKLEFGQVQKFAFYFVLGT